MRLCSVYYTSVGSCTCFRCWQTSLGARTTVITASGAGQPGLLPSALVVELQLIHDLNQFQLNNESRHGRNCPKNVPKFSNVELEKEKIFFQRFQVNFIVLAVLNVGARRDSVVNSTPWPLFRRERERASTHCIGGYCDSPSVSTVREISSDGDVESRDGPTRSESL